MNNILRSIVICVAMQSCVLADNDKKVIDPSIKRFNAWFGSFGGKSLKPENETLIRGVLHDIGVTEHVEIRKMSEFTLRSGFGMYANAFAHHIPGFSRAIVISEDFFDTLSDKAKIFLIRHEAAHLYYNHCPKRLAASLANLASFISLTYYSAFYVSQNQLHYSVPFLTKRISALIVSDAVLWAGLVASLKYTVAQEWEADHKAAENEDCLEGGIELFEKVQAYLDEAALEIPEENSIHTVLKNAGKVKSAFSTHPTFEERIAYLRELIKERDERIASAA